MKGRTGIEMKCKDRTEMYYGGTKFVVMFFVVYMGTQKDNP